MSLSYRKLFVLLLDRKLLKKDLQVMAGITGSIMARLSNNEVVRTDTLDKICSALNCKIEDIVEYVPDKKQLSEEAVLKIYNQYDIFHDTIDLDTFRNILRKCTEKITENETTINEDKLIKLLKREDNKRYSTIVPRDEKEKTIDDL